MNTIHTDKAPATVGPYSQAKVVGGFIIRFWSNSTRSCNWFHCCKWYRRAN